MSTGCVKLLSEICLQGVWKYWAKCVYRLCGSA